MIYIETDRLLLRDWISADTEPFVRMNLDPEVRRYFPALREREKTLADIENIKTGLTHQGYDRFAVELKATGAFIGFIGLAAVDFESIFTPCIDIGWRLDPSAWGQGYATEGARACLQAAFSRWHLPVIYAFTSIFNAPSEKVMQRIGMERIGAFQHPYIAEDHWLHEHVLYRALPPDSGR
jgi:[ribosomal protein S5]-alanine N-acetyltransferase